jgi:1,2-diacylglycerol 3-alpha-glucosyltransferase
MDDALAFVGSGTAIIEASACGVPSVVGIEDDQEGLTYGFLHQTAGFAYHSIGLNYGITSIYERLNYLVHCSFDEYQQECQLARKRSYDFSIEKTASDLTGAWEKYKPDYSPIGWIKVVTIIGSLLFNMLVNSKLVRNEYFGRHSSGI